MKYAHVKDGAVIRIIELDAPPPPHKASYILPYVEDKPTVDVRNQRLSKPVDEVKQAQVVRRWSVESVPHADMVNRVAVERERRLRAGFDYDFGDARGVHRIGTTEQDMVGWDEVTFVAQAAINAGLPAMEIAIVTDTGPATVTAMEWQSILLAAGAARQPIWAASFYLQALNQIPADYADDARWT